MRYKLDRVKEQGIRITLTRGDISELYSLIKVSLKDYFAMQNIIVNDYGTPRFNDLPIGRCQIRSIKLKHRNKDSGLGNIAINYLKSGKEVLGEKGVDYKASVLFGGRGLEVNYESITLFFNVRHPTVYPSKADSHNYRSSNEALRDMFYTRLEDRL